MELRKQVKRLVRERDEAEANGKQAQANSVEAQRVVAQKNAEIMRLGELLKMAGDDIIHAAQVNRRNRIEAADANRKNEIALRIALQYPPEGYCREGEGDGDHAGS